MTPAPTPVAEAVAASWGNAAEWATVGVAVFALGISFAAFAIATRSERRLQFMRLHELMTSLDSQQGRRMLKHHARSPRRLDRVWHFKSAEYDEVNRAVSMYHTLAIYAKRKYVPLDVALAQWGRTLTRSWEQIETFILWRDRRFQDADGWTDLLWFAEQAGAHLSPELRQTVAHREERVRIAAEASAAESDAHRMDPHHAG